ncbi:hypothetical protein SAMN05216223_10924 [Actinacidiphila yanglinensis]|uniref:Uncharacterized protein n=1 Tax=Actinacidiphila yanglinensis TaxID=310779 RepID=A0A1H6CIN0_9ACTN|nr:hypothetical protein SAMN05216223_10924 [Actinacidiphila yanglinensis]
MHRSTALRCLYASSVEAGRAATGAASPQSVTVLVGGLRDHGADTSPPAMLTDRRGRVRAVCQDGFRTQAAAGTSERVVIGISPKTVPLFPGSGVCW